MYANLVNSSEGRRPPTVDDRLWRLFCYGYQEPPTIPLTETEQKVYNWITTGYSVEAICNRLGCKQKRVGEIIQNLRGKRWIR